MSEGAISGKQVWQRHECVSCHTIFGNGGYVGADMTHIVAQRGSEYVLNYLVKPPVMLPNRKLHHPGLSGSEATQIVEYFEYLDKIPTLGWPPQPQKAEKES
ncbi:cytochrome c [Desulfitobacterium metallireducens]|nr:cytochrome c [Desulfitobacterium metallireducens]